MINTFRVTFITLAAVLAFYYMAAALTGDKNFNSAKTLEKYLNKQPANSPEKPIEVTMAANAQIMEDIAKTITSAGKYVSLNLSSNVFLTTIPHNAFYECHLLTAITIPQGVTSIEATAFTNCSGLANVAIPDSITDIGDFAFSGCSGLVSVTIPDRVSSIGAGTFANCTGLVSIAIPDSVTSIGNSAFSGCSGLARVTIPDSVKSIGNSAFSGCSSLTSVKFEGTVNFESSFLPNTGPFAGLGDLLEKYLAYGIGTYTRESNSSKTWDKL